MVGIHKALYGNEDFVSSLWRQQYKQDLVMVKNQAICFAWFEAGSMARSHCPNSVPLETGRSTGEFALVKDLVVAGRIFAERREIERQLGKSDKHSVENTMILIY